jgi:protein-tyrosine-phosphatase/DNA-binding transcriptional ArsR family regulator
MKTSLAPPPPLLALLAHEQRWNLVRALSSGDLRVQELMERVREPANLVSYHLRRLREHAVVRERRSSSDRRDVYYSLDLDRVAYLYRSAGESLHPGLSPGGVDLPAAASPATRVPGPPPRVLFVCTHNSARSQMAEALLRHHGAGLVEAASAGSDPTELHPFAVWAMARQGIDIRAQRAKSLAAVAELPCDRLVTCCDVARETCAALPAGVEAQHWSLPDPAAVEGSDEAKRRAFEDIARELRTRIRFLIAALGVNP